MTEKRWKPKGTLKISMNEYIEKRLEKLRNRPDSTRGIEQLFIESIYHAYKEGQKLTRPMQRVLNDEFNRGVERGVWLEKRKNGALGINVEKK